MPNAQEFTQPTDTKVAYVAGIADTMNSIGATKWASADDYETAIVGLASKLAFDPAAEDTPPTPHKTAQVIEAVWKLAKFSADEAEKEKDTKTEAEAEADAEKEVEKEREAIIEAIEDPEAKKEARAYFDTLDMACYKVAVAVQGEDPGNVVPNTTTNAAAADSTAAIEMKNRPEGFAENAPAIAHDPSADGGQLAPHPNKDSVGKTAAEQLLSEIIGPAKAAAALAGENPGTNVTDNTLATASGSDSVAAVELKNRPEGAFAGTPTDEPSANIGKEQPHPNKDSVGKTAADREAMAVAKIAMAYPTFARLPKETKVAHMRALMVLEPVQQGMYLERLSNRSLR